MTVEATERLRLALRATAPNSDAGDGLQTLRAEEAAAVRAFLRAGRGGAMYVCGPVGCGKTATVLAEAAASKPAARVHVLNCASQGDSADGVLRWLLRCCGGAATTADASSLSVAALRLRFERWVRRQQQPKQRRTAVVTCVLDEIDDIAADERGRSLLDWLMRTAASCARLALLGIGNDARVPGGSGVQVVRFRGYDAGAIERVLRLRLGGLCVFDDVALQLIARNAAAMGGDLRAALTMCREPLLRAFGAWQQRQQPLRFPLTLADVRAVVAALADDTRALIAALPMQQRLLLAAFLAVGTPTSTRAELYGAYQALCERIGSAALSVAVLFREALGPLVDLNCIRPSLTKLDSFELVVAPADAHAAIVASSATLASVFSHAP